MRVIGTVAFLIAGLGIITFTILYGVWSYWRATQAGKALFGFMLVCSLLLISMLVRASGEFPGSELLGQIWYIPLAISVWWFVWILIKSQRKDRKDARNSRGS